jgi:hypothetical protein
VIGNLSTNYPSKPDQAKTDKNLSTDFTDLHGLFWILDFGFWIYSVPIYRQELGIGTVGVDLCGRPFRKISMMNG